MDTETGATEMLAQAGPGKILLALLVLSAIRLLLVWQRHYAGRRARRGAQAVSHFLTEMLDLLLVAGTLVFLLIRPFLLQAFFIPTGSMENTLLGHKAGENGYTTNAHDFIFVNKFRYRAGDPGHGDIAVFLAPPESDNSGKHEEHIFIKRVIGTPGDTIFIPHGVVYRNGKPLDESDYIKEPMEDDGRFNDTSFATQSPLKLNSGEYFVMGDNRNHSYDSRYWGVVTRNRMMGRAFLIFYPFSRMRLLDSAQPRWGKP
jgi:signal peptidase I